MQMVTTWSRSASNGMNLNKAFILGNLTRDPELRQTPGGQSVCTFSAATNRFFTDSTGQRQKQAEFHNIVAWGRQAEIVNQYLHKGSAVLIEGRLQTRNWQDAQGVKHWKTEIIAERIQLGPKGEGRVRGEDDEPKSGSSSEKTEEPSTPIIELPGDESEIDVKDIPF